MSCPPIKETFLLHNHAHIVYNNICSIRKLYCFKTFRSVDKIHFKFYCRFFFTKCTPFSEGGWSTTKGTKAGQFLLWSFTKNKPKKITFISLFEPKTISSVGNSGCPDGWIPRHTLDGLCYCSGGTPMKKLADYAGAEHACEDIHPNAHVMSIGGQDEEDYFIKII